MNDTPPAKHGDVARAGLGLAVCCAAALASAGFVVAVSSDRHWATWFHPTAPFVRAANVTGVVIFASTSVGRRTRWLAGCSCAAFSASLLAEAVAAGLAAGHASAEGYWLLATASAWVQLLELTGQALLAVAAARVAALRFPAASLAGDAAVVLLLLTAAGLVLGDVVPPVGPWVWGAPRAAAYAASVAVLALAFCGVPSAPHGGEADAAVDAVAILPLVLAARWSCAVAAGLVRATPGHELAYHPTDLRIHAAERLFAALCIACVVAILRSPLRSGWTQLAVALVVAGEVASLDDSLAAAGRVVLAGGTGCLLLGLAGSPVGESATTAGARQAIGSFLVTASATMPSTSGGGGKALVALVATGALATGTRLLVPACRSIARALALAPMEAAGDDFDDDIADAAMEPAAPGPGVTAPAVNPYAAPTSGRQPRRGRLGGRKLRTWRGEVRRAVLWLLAPLVGFSAIASAIVLAGGIAGALRGHATGYVDAVRATTAEFAPLFLVGHFLATAVALRAGFRLTSRPPVEIPALDAPLQVVLRLAMSAAMAAQVAHAVVCVAYGWGAASDMLRWIAVTSRVAYAACALHGAQLFAAMDRSRAAQALRLSALAYLCMAASSLLWGTEGADPRVDTVLAASLAAAACAAGFALRAWLRGR